MELHQPELGTNMGLCVPPKDGDWTGVRKGFRQISRALEDYSFYSLTASRLLSTNSVGKPSTVSDLTNWIAGTANRVTVANDGDGTVTLSGPQDFHTGASPEFADLTLSAPSNIYALSHDSFANVHQDVNTDASPEFANVVLAESGTVSGVGTPTLTFSANWPKVSIINEADDDSLFLQRIVGANSSSLGFGINSTNGYSYIQSNRIGSGTILPLRLYVSNNYFVEIDTSGNTDLQAGNLTTTGIINASAGKVLVTDNGTTAPTLESDGYIGVAMVNGEARIYFKVNDIMWYINTDGIDASPVPGNPIGLLLTLTYA